MASFFSPRHRQNQVYSAPKCGLSSLPLSVPYEGPLQRVWRGPGASTLQLPPSGLLTDHRNQTCSLNKTTPLLGRRVPMTSPQDTLLPKVPLPSPTKIPIWGLS